ncbi:hypothetical protein J3E71DRAFT_389139 [Bipolaris maydis]|nr:hypothetical protein J3E71DRAFT_389139 [Bipolaris maydis]
MTLTSLPNELIEHIASYLDLPSTRSLRLTTSSLTKASSHLFKDRFFQQRTLFWTKPSLDTFVQISLHPQYGNALRHLIIDATPQHSMRLWQLSKQITEITPFPSSSSSSSKAATSPEQCSLQDAWAQAAEKAAQNTSFFNETRHDQKALKQAFANMSQENHLTTITFLYMGLASSLVKGGRTYCALSQCEISRPFVSTLAALAASPHIRLSRIALHKPFDHGAVSIGRLESLAPLLPCFDKAFSTLTHLALNLRDWREQESGFELAPPLSPSSSSPLPPRPPFIVRFLSKMHSLTSLQLSCYSNFEHDVFEQIASHCCFDKLVVCKLSVMRVERIEWLDMFLARSLRGPLRELCLRHVMLGKREGSGWVEWMKRIAVEQQDLSQERVCEGQAVPPAPAGITHFCFADLFTGQGEVLHVRGSRSLCLGEDWTCQLLNALDSGAQGKEWRPQWDMCASAYPFVGLSM